MSGPAIAFMWIALVVGVPAGLAALLRVAGAPGGRFAPAIAGGILAGLLLGASIGGRVVPDFHEAVFVGAATERAALDSARSGAEARRQAILATGVSPAALEEVAFDDLQVIAPLQREADAAQRAHDTMVFRWTAILAALLGMGAFATVRAAAAEGVRRASTFAAGVSAPIGAFVGTWLCASVVLPIDRTQAMWVSVALAMTALGPLRATLPAHTRVALALGLGGAVASAVGAVVVGGVAIVGALGIALGAPAPKRASAFVARNIALPALACAAMLGADWHVLKGSGDFWITLVLVLVISGDLRWLGARLALTLGGAGRGGACARADGPHRERSRRGVRGGRAGDRTLDAAARGDGADAR